MAQQQQQKQQQRWWWQQDDIYGVTPQHTGVSQASRPNHSREDRVEEKRPPLPPRRSTSSFQQKWQQDDIYGVTPQHTGGTQFTRRTQPSPVRTRDGGSEPREKVPPLPPRRSTSSFHQHQYQQKQQHHHHLHDQTLNAPDRAPPPPPPQAAATLQRSKERVLAYMIPLPQPHGPSGLPLAIPQRYMLYLPPAPDLLKPDPSSADGGAGSKERKRDKAHRRWQEEVRKAKTYNGAVVTMRGLYSASVRGAVYVLAMLQRNELTFLSRLPRRTLRELELLHPGPASPGGRAAVADEERFAEVRAEFERNRRVARRDFWIATVLLPFATAIDLVIPVFGGLSEVDLVWMVVTGRAWMAARGVAKRLVLAPGVAARALSDGSSSGCGSGGSSGHAGDGTPPYQCAGALGGHDDDDDDDDRQPRVSNFTEHLDEEHPLFDNEEKRDRHGSGRRKHAQRKEQPVEMSFRSSTSMTMVTHYVRAACHARNARLFPDVGPPQTEAEVLRSMGWAPEEGRHRTAEDAEADVAWQVRKTSEDLRSAVAKAAKTWDKQCRRFAAEDAERAMGAAEAGARGRAQWRKELFDEEDD